MLSQAALAQTAFQQGSLVSYHYQLRLPETARSAADIANSGPLPRDFRRQAGAFRTAQRGARPKALITVWRCFFLSRAGHAGGGGVGIANAVKHLDGKRNVIAVFKCLGAPGSFIFSLSGFKASRWPLWAFHWSCAGRAGAFCRRVHRG